MTRESSPPIAGKDRESDCAESRGPSVFSERSYLAAARIAQKLRDAGFKCEIVSLVSTGSSVLRLTLSKH
jgi:hypothetical protein